MNHELSLFEMLMVFVRLGAVLLLAYGIIAVVYTILMMILHGVGGPAIKFLHTRVGRILMAGLLHIFGLEGVAYAD